MVMFDETRMTLSASITGNQATMNRETDFNTLEFFLKNILKSLNYTNKIVVFTILYWLLLQDYTLLFQERYHKIWYR